MTVGQLAFAFATSFPLAVLARAVVGAGDATIFVSVIRLVTLWFLVRQAPLITQLNGPARPARRDRGGGTALVALSHLGWTRSFAIASSLGVVGMVGGLGVACSGQARFGGNAQGRRWGFFTFADYFTDRQLVALTTFSDLVSEAREQIVKDALDAGLTTGLRLGGRWP